MDGSALTPFALVFMLLSMGAVSALTVYCFYRILTGGQLSDPEETVGAGRSGERAEGRRRRP